MSIFENQMKRGILKPGSSIKAAQIIQELGISKTPLRDALIQLEAEGFVTILPQRGVVIQFAYTQGCREYLPNPGRAGICCNNESIFKNRRQKEIAEFEHLNKQMVLLAGISNCDFREYNQVNILFHDVFLNLCDNEMLLRYARILKTASI